VLLYRLDVPKRFPRPGARWEENLEGRIDERRMIRMNAAAELEGKSFAEAATLFDTEGGPQRAAPAEFFSALFGPDFLRLTGEHLLLVFVSLAASIVLGVAARRRGGEAAENGAAILGTVGVIQTIPSLALFAFLIALTARSARGPRS